MALLTDAPLENATVLDYTDLEGSASWLQCLKKVEICVEFSSLGLFMYFLGWSSLIAVTKIYLKLLHKGLRVEFMIYDILIW